jgi:hypothetical protein
MKMRIAGRVFKPRENPAGFFLVRAKHGVSSAICLAWLGVAEALPPALQGRAVSRCHNEEKSNGQGTRPKQEDKNSCALTLQ